MRWLIYAPLMAVLLPVAAYGVTAGLVGRDAVWATWFGPVDRQPVDFATLRPGPEPHFFLVCPPGWCADVRQMEAPVFDRPVTALQADFLDLIARTDTIAPLPAAAASGAAGAENRQLSFEARTPLLRFPDTVTVRFFDVGESRSSLAIYSRSHYGYGDLGTNEARVRRLLAALEDRTD